jgi:hypothetical protein
MLGRRNAAALNNQTTTNLDALAIPDVAAVGAPAERECAVAPAPLILEPAATLVIEDVTILNPEAHWKWKRQQAIDLKERSSLDYDPSFKKKKKKGEGRNPSTTAPPPDDSRRWKSKFELLLAFQHRHGHCRIPAGETTEWPIVQQKKLLRWVSDQRTQYRNVLTGQGKTAPTLTQRHIELLDLIGFEWEGLHKRRTGRRPPDDQSQ